MKKLAVILLSLIIASSFAACSSSSDAEAAALLNALQSNASQVSEKVSDIQEQASQRIEDVSSAIDGNQASSQQFTDEQVIKGFEGLLDKIKTIDDTELSSIVIGDFEKKKNTFEEMKKFLNSNSAQKRNTILIGEYDGAYTLHSTYYITDAANNRIESQFLTGTVRYDNNEWKFDETVTDSSHISEAVGEKLKDFSERLYKDYKNDKYSLLTGNSTEFNVFRYDYLFLNGNCMHEDVHYAQIIGAFENDDSIDLLVVMNNGTSSNMTFKSFTIAFKDSKTNENMYSGKKDGEGLTWNINEIVPAKGSKLTYLTIDKNQLKKKYQSFVTDKDLEFSWDFTYSY